MARINIDWVIIGWLQSSLTQLDYYRVKLFLSSWRVASGIKIETMLKLFHQETSASLHLDPWQDWP